MKKKELLKEIKADLKAGKEIMVITIDKATKENKAVKVRVKGDFNNLRSAATEALQVKITAGNTVIGKDKEDRINREKMIADIKAGKQFFALTLTNYGDKCKATISASIDQEDLKKAFDTIFNSNHPIAKDIKEVALMTEVNKQLDELINKINRKEL